MNAQEFLTYWIIIKKRLWLIVLLFVVTMGAMVVASYLSEPVYEAKGLFQVTAPLPADVSLFTDFRTSTSRDELGYTKNNFLGVLKSNFVVGQVVDEFELNIDADQFLEDKVVIEPSQDSDLVTLTVTAENPKLATDIANTLIEKGAQRFGEMSASSITANKKLIQKQMEKIKVQLDEAKAALTAFQIENGVGSMDGVLRAQESLISQLALRRDESLARGDDETAANYDQIMATRERQIQTLILLASEYDTLQDAVKRIDLTYSDLLDKETEATLKENEIQGAKFVRIIPAREPTRPLPRLNIKLLLIGAMVSLVLGIILAFVLDALESVSIARPEEENVFSKPTVVGASME